MDLLDLFAKIGIDTSEYEAGINNASGMADKLGGAIKTGMKVGVAAIGAVTAATAALGKGLVDGTKKWAEYGDNIDKASQKLGFSAEAYQEWDAILQHSGSSIDALAAPMRTLNKLAESGSEAFTELGISQEELAGMSNEELFEATIAGLQGIADEGERSRLATELLGKGAMELQPLLNTTAEDTEAMRQRVHELGGVMSDESVKASAAFQDSLQDLGTAFDGLKRGLVADFMPGLTTVMDGLTEIFSGDPDSGIAMITEGIDGVLTTMTDNLPMFLDTGVAIIQALLDAFINNLPKILEMGGKLLGELIAGLIKNIPTLVRSIPDIIMAIVNGLAAAWPDIRAAGADLLNMVGEGLLAGLDKAKEWGRDLIQNFIDGIKGKFTALGDAVSGAASTVKKFLGFSEPEEGPLSDFHTYAPDMMSLFISGIADKKRDLRKELADITSVIPDALGDVDISAPTVTATGGYSLGGAEPITVDVTLELDGGVLARKMFNYNAAETRRRGTPLMQGGMA